MNNVCNCLFITHFFSKMENNNNPQHRTDLKAFNFISKQKMYNHSLFKETIKLLEGMLISQMNWRSRRRRKNLHRNTDLTSSPWRQHSSQGEPPQTRIEVVDPGSYCRITSKHSELGRKRAGGWFGGGDTPPRMLDSRVQVRSSVPVLEQRGFNLQPEWSGSRWGWRGGGEGAPETTQSRSAAPNPHLHEFNDLKTTE